MTSYFSTAILVFVASFILFRGLYLHSKPGLRVLTTITALVFAVPSMLFLSNYILHAPSQSWFYTFHSIPGIEATSGLIGALLGVTSGFIKRYLRLFAIPVLLALTCIAAILVVVPFAKQFIFKLDYSKLHNEWKHGVCKQTSASTCVPASCATVIRTLGGNVTEQELAKAAGTTSRGTEIWYMMRAIRKFGYKIEAHTAKSMKDVQTPAIVGVDGCHVVVMMSKNDTGPEIGNSLGAKRYRYTWDAFQSNRDPAPVYFVVKPLKGR